MCTCILFKTWLSMLLKIIWDSCMNSFAPKNSRSAPKISRFSVPGVQEQTVHWQQQSLWVWIQKPKLPKTCAIMKWGQCPWSLEGKTKYLPSYSTVIFLSNHFGKPGCLYSARTMNILQHWNGAEICRVPITWLDAVLQLRHSWIPLWVPLQSSPYL